MFRGDFEFHEDAAPSHLGGQATRAATAPIELPEAFAKAATSAATTPHHKQESPPAAIPAMWAPDAEKELRKIPFFVRGKARRNSVAFAQDHRVPVITVETLYDAKAHFSR